MHRLEEIYNAYLHEQSQQYRELYAGHEDWFSASSAGQCYRKQWYRVNGQKPVETEPQSSRLLRLGTILHKDMEEAIRWFTRTKDSNETWLLEHEVKIPKLRVLGHLDIAIISEDQHSAQIYDIKTAKAYSWTKRFGQKKNRDLNPSRNYELQIATYGMGLANHLGLDPDNIELNILWYRKDDSFVRIQKISPKYGKLALNYWTDLFETLEEIRSADELTPDEDVNVPVQDWECSYCQFTDVCDGKDIILKRKIKERKNAKGHR